jgi:hypothetical protein
VDVVVLGVWLMCVCGCRVTDGHTNHQREHSHN